jgi:hypothetical protein
MTWVCSTISWRFSVVRKKSRNVDIGLIDGGNANAARRQIKLVAAHVL